ncbi:MAG TPA: MDR family MFS transporter [bacterium]|nr:MDR family MFS transporter [bacterium]
MSASVATAAERIDYASTLSGQTKAFILIGVLLGLFLAALDQTIVATALPAIIADLRGIDLLAWVSTGYLLASTAMVPIYGRLSDFYGRRPVLLFGILVFLAGSALCGVAATMMQLVAFRVLQGIGAAALTSTAFAVPADLYPPAERARYQGLFGAVFALSSVIGPYVGGLLTDQLNWRWVFYVNVPLGVVAIIFILARMPRLASGVKAAIDWAGTALLILAVVPLLLGLTLDKSLYPWSSPLIVGLFMMAAIATVGFIIVERRASAPVIPLDLFRNRTFTVVVLASLLTGAAFFGAIVFISLFMVNVVGVSATAAGTTLMPLTMAVVAGAFTASMIVQRLGRYKVPMLVGYIISIIGFLLLSVMDASVTRSAVTWRMIVLGLGLGPTMPLLTLVIQNAVSYDRVGAVTASRQFFMQIGAAIGIAVFGVVLSAALTSEFRSRVSPQLAQLPPEVRGQIDLAQLRSGQGGRSAGLLARLGPRSPLRRATREAFAKSVTRVYRYAVFLAAAALLVTLALPELPLRTSNRPGAGPPVAAGGK